jgi:hypothetical protein
MCEVVDDETSRWIDADLTALSKYLLDQKPMSARARAHAH